MKMQNIALDEIIWNPWRDKKLYPVDDDHVAELRQSINDHGFFGGIKGRRRNGKVEIGCGHARLAAARKAKIDGEPIETIPIFVADLDDDEMLRLMTDENATQAGSHPGAVMNEVAAVTRRLIDGLLEVGTIVPTSVKVAFDNKRAIDQATTQLRNGTDIHRSLGRDTIRRYLGQGNPDRSHRTRRAVDEAMAALKQSGCYDDMVEQAISKHPQLISDKPAKGTQIEKTDKKPRKRVLDERCANLFPNEHQFNAFREAVTSPAAQKVIPVNQQHALAKEIMGATNSQFSKKQAGAPYIRKMVQNQVQQALKAQRDINKEEKEAFLAEQREARINSELHSANASLRSLISALAKMADLVDEFPSHPKLGGFAARLDTLVKAIEQFSKKLK